MKQPFALLIEQNDVTNRQRADGWGGKYIWNSPPEQTSKKMQPTGLSIKGRKCLTT
jgi:hypothetical protein